MTEFAERLVRLQMLDPVLTEIGLLGLLLLLFRWPRDQAGPLRNALAVEELELCAAQTGASRAEALAEESARRSTG